MSWCYFVILMISARRHEIALDNAARSIMVGYLTNHRSWRVLAIKVVAAFSEWPVELGHVREKHRLPFCSCSKAIAD